MKAKDRNGGETIILDVDFDDRAVSEFKPYDLPKKGQSSTTGETHSKTPSAEQARYDSVGQKLRRVVLYKPKDKHAPIFLAANAGYRIHLSSCTVDVC